MKLKKLSSLAIFIVLFIAGVMNSSAQTKKSKDGFESLFNGKNLDGWYLKIKSGDAELAKKVYAVDVGHSQLVPELSNDFRVINMEKTNIRTLEKDKISDIIPGETGQKVEDFAKNAAEKAEDLFDSAKDKLSGLFGNDKK